MGIGMLRALWKSDARWARILEIRRTGPLAQILLEVHEGDKPPFEHWTRTAIPFGRTPKVGDDVYWVDHTGAESTRRAIAIRWRRTPNYGSTAPTSEDLQRAFLPGLPAASEPIVPDLPAGEDDPAVHRRRLEERRAAGDVTDAEYAKRSAELDAWEKGLATVRAAGGRP